MSRTATTGPIRSHRLFFLNGCVRSVSGRSTKTVVGPVPLTFEAFVFASVSRLVFTSPLTGPEPSLIVPASRSVLEVSVRGGVPSTRQKPSVSSDSSRLHWGQRFILYWGRFIRRSSSLNRGSLRNSSSSGCVANELDQ